MEKQESNEKTTSLKGVGLLGEYLKQKRIDKNYTLDKLSQKTKISVNILKSLESNDYDHLPSAAYIKGFVTSYVKVLGLPLDEAINKMEYTYLNVLGKPFPALNHTKLLVNQTPAPLGVRPEANEESLSPNDVIENSDSFIENTKSFLPVIIFGTIILIFVGGYQLISSIVESEVSDQKTKNLGPRIESSSALLKQHVPEVKKVEAPGTLETAPVPGPQGPATVVKTEDKPLKTFPRNFPQVEFKKVKGRLFSVKMDAPENDNEAIFPTAMKEKMNPDMQNLYIRAVDGNTWVSYKIDNNPIESVIISKGNDLFIQGNEIRIFLGNVNVTKIFYNNYMIETPTKSGVKSLIFPEESNKKFQIPLFPKAKDDILYTSEEYIKRMKMEEDEIEKVPN